MLKALIKNTATTSRYSLLRLQPSPASHLVARFMTTSNNTPIEAEATQAESKSETVTEEKV